MTSPYTKDPVIAAAKGMNAAAGIWPVTADQSMTSHRFGDADGNTILALGQPDDLDAPIVVTSVDYGFPDLNTVMFPRTSADGEIDETQTHGGRTLSLTMLIRGDDQHPAAWYLDALRGLGVPANRPYLYAQEIGWDTERRMRLRCDQFSNPMDRANGPVILAQASYRVPDGVFESPDVQQMTVYPTTSTSPSSGIGLHFAATSAPTVPVTGGLHFPATATPATPPASGGVTFAAEQNPPSSPPVPLAGNDNVYPVIRIYGPVTGPVITNLDTGDMLAFTGTPGSTLPGLTIPSGDYVEIDMREHTVYDLGNPGFPLLNTLDFTRSTFWHLTPGDNRIAFTGTGRGAATSMVILWRDTWI